jgi:hypothetical protein
MKRILCIIPTLALLGGCAGGPSFNDIVSGGERIVTGPIGRFVSQNLQTAARAFECRKIATDPVGSLRYTFDSATCAALGGTVGSAVMVPAGTPVVTP